ncbi:MAG: hypothetical protein WC528_05185 [Patescibacteria group bacterium]
MSSFSEGQTHQLMDALEGADYTSAHITKLGQYKDLRGIRDVLEGKAEIVYFQHPIINCDAQPRTHSSWKMRIEKHLKGGQLRWDSNKVELWFCDEQKNGSIWGDQLRKKLKGQPVLNACVLEYLLNNPRLIPESWKGKQVFFWGTIYRYAETDQLQVRYLCWRDGKWSWNFYWLGHSFDGSCPAALACK